MNKEQITYTTTLLLAILLAFSISSCTKKESEEKLDLVYDMGDFGIFDMLVTGSRQQVYNNTFRPELTSALSSHTANELTLNSVLLDELVLTITSPSGANFNGISYFAAYVTADDMDTLEIASIDGLASANRTSVELTSNGNDMDEYFKKEECRLLIYAFNIRPVGILEQLRVDIDFKAAASVTIKEE